MVSAATIGEDNDFGILPVGKSMELICDIPMVEEVIQRIVALAEAATKRTDAMME